MLVGKQTYSENHHYPKKYLPRKKFKPRDSSFPILSCSAFNSAFVANVVAF